MNRLIEAKSKAAPWNKGKLVGQKALLRLKEIWPSGSDCSSPIEFGNRRSSTSR